jgi:uncharacterized repeat protein (TIGR01451 family)
MYDSHARRPFASWLRSFGKLFGGNRRKTAGETTRRQVLRFETLESRSLLSVTLLPTISGSVFQDLNGNGVDNGEPALAGVTVTLFQDNGSGQFSASDSIFATSQTNNSGKYQFLNVPVGTYWVQQSPASGYALESGQSPREVQVTSQETQGTFGTVVDAFNTTSQLITASRASGVAAASSAAAPEAIGSERDLYAKLTSSDGSVTLDVNTNNPGVFEASYSGQATGTYQVIWDGKAGETSVTNPTGLNHADLTSGGLSTGFGFTIGADHATSFTVLIYTDAGDWSQATIPVPAGSGAATDNVFVPFSSFTIGAGSGATFSNVGAVELQSSSGPSVQTEMKLIGSLEPTPLSGGNFANITQADLAIVKTASPNPAIAGNALTYSLAASNLGPSNATGVTITDTLPAGVTYASATSSEGTVSQTGGTVTVSLGALADGAAATATILVTMNPGTRGTITNTAVIAGNQPDPNLANNTSTVTTQVNTQTDLAIVKSASPNPVIAGNALTYSLAASNLGPSNATGVTVTDTLPAGVTYTSATSSLGTVTQAGGTVTVNVGALASGAGATATILVMVGPSARGTITNTAFISGNEPDPNLANNTSTVTTQINPQTDLAIVKSASPNPAVAGNTLTYTLAASNLGPSNATGVTITDTLPAGVSYTSATTSLGTVSQAGGKVTVNVGALASGAGATATILVTAGPTTRGTITNTAVISGNEPDPNLANNTSTVITQVNALDDLAIVKTASANPVIAGNALTYTLAATNNGPSNATGVTITDTLPAGVTYTSATSSLGTVTQAGGTVTVNVGALASGAGETATILVMVGPSTRGSITNTAVIAGNEPETTLANNTSTVTTQVNAQADLAIVKSALPFPAVPGSALTYTLTASDLGPSSATGVTMSDTLPADVTYALATTNQGTVSQAGGTVTVNVGSLAVGGTATATILVTIDPATRGSITNTAVVSGNEPDPNLANNTATVTTMVSPQIDLAIVKSASPNPVIAGASLSYTLTASDLGPSDATGVTITDTLPAGVTYVSAASGQGTVSQSGGTVTVSVGNLNEGATATATILVTVNPSTRGSITNTAVVAGNEQETNTANNTATVTTQVDPLDDLSITKTASASSVKVGAFLTYTLTASNAGPSDGTGVIVSDTLPAGLTYDSAASSLGTVSRAGNTITVNVGNLAAGKVDTVTIVVTVASGTGSITNTAKISGNEPETTLANNSASVTTFIIAWINPPQNVNPSKWYFLS